jgi:hypothetical protein
MARSEEPSESEHNAAHSGSAALCDALYSALRQRIPPLQQHKNRNKCRLGLPQYAIAHLWHSKKAPRIVVWFRSSTNEERTEAGIFIRPRQMETYGGFAQFGARFEISDLNQVPAACEIICKNSILPDTSAR